MIQVTLLIFLKSLSEIYNLGNGVPTIIANTYARYGTIFTFLGPEYKFTEKLMVNKEPMVTKI